MNTIVAVRVPTQGISIGLLRHWAAIAAKRSYWHTNQSEGKYFVPGVLWGYFNDLTSKAAWRGRVDDDGLPLVRLDSHYLHLPTMLFHKALAHWDLWLGSGRTNDAERSAFSALAEWGFTSLDRYGGWPVPQIGRCMLCPYSAMTQGEGISVLCRAHSLSGDSAFLDRAHLAAKLMLAPVDEGGTARYLPQGIVLEEFPVDPPNTVLNGWIFALMGLYDLHLASGDSGIARAIDATLDCLISALPSYDAQYWSLYDSEGSIASPFYHLAHIAQLRMLAVAFPTRACQLEDMAITFERYARSRRLKLRAVIRKAYEKLRTPPARLLTPK